MLDLDSNQGASPFHACPVSPTCPYCLSPELPTSIDWSPIEAAYCISLREREDRARAAEAQFHRVGLCRKVVFYRPAIAPRPVPVSGPKISGLGLGVKITLTVTGASGKAVKGATVVAFTNFAAR